MSNENEKTKAVWDFLTKNPIGTTLVTADLSFTGELYAVGWHGDTMYVWLERNNETRAAPAISVH
jgi:hypothetical protein